MKFNCFPTPHDVLEGLEKGGTQQWLSDAQAAIDWAVLEAERLTEEAIRQEEREVRVILGRGEYRLAEHPVEGVRIGALPKELWSVEESQGVIFAKGFGVPYTVNYRVGYGDGKLPTAHQVLIGRLARMKLGVEGLSDEEKETFVRVVRRLRQARDRDGDNIFGALSKV